MLRTAFLIAFSSIFLTRLTSYAQTPSTTTPRPINERLNNLQTAANKHTERIVSLEQNRENLNGQLVQIKDERKKELIIKISDRINGVNQKRTDIFAKTLERIKNVLNKIKEKKDALKKEGIDTQKLEIILSDADKDIALASIAITEQSKKIYTIRIISEPSLRTDIEKVVKELQTDLQNTYEKIYKAKQSVQEAARTLNILKSNIPEVSPSVTPNI